MRKVKTESDRNLMERIVWKKSPDSIRLSLYFLAN